MSLLLLDSLSLPGDPAKPNEDAFGQADAAAIVLDGATPLFDDATGGLMPGPSDAAWIAQFGARRVLAHLREDKSPRKALRDALGDTQKSFEALRRRPPQAVWQTPCASMILVAEDESEVEFLVLGDCGALVKDGDSAVQIIGEGFDKRAAEAQRATMLAQEKGIAPAAQRPQFLEALRASRNRINTGNSWLFSPDVKAAAHAARRTLRLSPGAVILLASDGFLALASDYGAYSADTLLAAAQDRGLEALGEELRAIETGDAAGEKFPRFKTSDDATALLMRVA